ncbi:transport and Golgi organization 2 homolog isoform X2 [Sipha flava]|nr:transport and Golgi organization 2 homolog isoform X2 [Sipha flava]
MNGGYRLIVASNRDEYYDRATLPADYWSEDRDVIGGRDLEPSSVGGTWMALNVRGKLAILLNVFQRDQRPNAKSRGRLVEDFVKGDTPAPDYMQRLQDVYNGFQLITITMSESFLETHFFTNCIKDDNGLKVESLPNGVQGFGNAPFLKVANGERRFNEIVKKYGHSNTKDILIEELLNLLKWDKKHYPDEMITKMSPNHQGNDGQKLYSSVFVEIPALRYGTRTHTIILVDHNGKIDYNEWTLSNSNWEQRCFTTALKCRADC